MPKTYEPDLRRGLLNAYESSKDTQAELAETFGVSTPSIVWWRDQLAIEGDVNPKAHPGFRIKARNESCIKDGGQMRGENRRQETSEEKN